jgi:copper homeostasis protein
MDNQYILEICAYSVEGSIAAQEGGANRIELCDNLSEGGTTPSAATIELTRYQVSIDLNIIIRPRGGDFCYSNIEFETMAKDIEVAKSLGANGVVLGILLPDGSVDINRTKKLVELAKPMSVTFHRAFDMTRDPLSALEDVCLCGADRILTSGQKSTAMDGIDLIKELVNLGHQRIIIMPGSGVNDCNILELATTSGATEFHMSAKKKVDGIMRFRKPGISMGGEENGNEYQKWITDWEQVRKVSQILVRINARN